MYLLYLGVAIVFGIVAYVSYKNLTDGYYQYDSIGEALADTALGALFIGFFATFGVGLVLFCASLVIFDSTSHEEWRSIPLQKFQSNPYVETVNKGGYDYYSYYLTNGSGVSNYSVETSSSTLITSDSESPKVKFRYECSDSKWYFPFMFEDDGCEDKKEYQLIVPTT